MAYLTYRQNIKPMLFSVAFMMVIFLCLFRAIITFKRRCFLNLAITNSMFYSLSCLVLFGVSSGISGYSFSMSSFVFFSLAILLSCSFALFCLMIFTDSFQIAYFAISSISTFIFIVFVKLRKLFNLIALRATFCYDCFIHNVLSLQKNVLVRADRALIALYGSFYYILENE